MATQNTPSAYICTYHKYNSGSLRGAWMDLTKYESYDAFINDCKDLHKDEADPELMCLDFQNMPDGLTMPESFYESDFVDIVKAWKEEQEGENTKYEIIDYSEKSIALIGDTKTIKDQLKKLGGRFNSHLSCGAGWIFPKSAETALRAFLDSGEVSSTTDSGNGSTIAQISKEEFVAELEKAKVFDVDYYTKKCSAYKLPSGKVIMIDKPKIETQFCFGYGCQGMTSEEASECAENARESGDYFLNENLDERFDKKIRRLESRDFEKYIYRHFKSNEHDVNLYGWSCDRHITEDEKERWGYIALSDGDKEVLINILKQERAAFEKRLRSYLKRYGTSKLHIWTYWADE